MENYYLKIDGPLIKGESVSGQGKDQIELLSWSHSVSMPVSHSHASGVSVKHGRCDHADLTVSKYMDGTTPVMNQHVSGGTNFKTATLTVFMADKDTASTQEYYRIELEDVICTSISLGAGGSDRAVETLTLHYNKIKWTYTPQKRDAASGAAGKVVTGWDLEKNCKV